jgi:hypothetical protein
MLAPILVGVVLVAGMAGNGAGGAMAADFLRSTVGAQRTAQIESAYLNAEDLWQQTLYHAGATKVKAPWTPPATPSGVPVTRRVLAERQIPTTRSATPSTAAAPTPTPTTTLRQQPELTSLKTVVSPSLSGEGIWTPSVAPASPRDPVPLVAKAFVRPDPSRPYAIVTVLRFDLRYVALHLVAGTSEPGGYLGHDGTGTIPTTDQVPGRLLAAFNGGFKYADGAYGMMTNGVVYVPPVAGAATVAMTRDGHVLMGAWGQDPALTATNRRLIAWRQNGELLINHGAVSPAVANGGDWGTTVLNDVHTWRSALGVGRHGVLLYAAGNALSVAALAQVMKEAGAKAAMELDINPYWVRADLYGRDPAWRLTMLKLRPDMAGTGYDFLDAYDRDFFYITRIPGRSHA